MARLKTYMLAGGTVFAALTIGFVMQHDADNRRSGFENPAPVKVQQITNTSSAAAVRIPNLPSDRKIAPLPDTPLELVAAEKDGADATDAMPQDETATAGFQCDISMEATPNAGAMVDLIVTAPCYGSEHLTIHHNGLMFTATTQPDGTYSVSVPALAEKALFIAAFDNGEGMTATADVPTLAFYDRVALQWKGESGLQLHAREFDADYFTDGHVWAASAGDMTRTAKGEGGFLTHLGESDSSEALMAEIYSFPAGTATRSGEIALSVEAEITEANCDSDVEAQTLELNGGGELAVKDLSIEMPACDAVGDFLVLKNLIEDMKIAANH